MPTSYPDCGSGGAGDPTIKEGLGIYVYAAGRDMDARSAFYSADGDLLLVPQEGALDVRTELGWLLVRPLEICVVPRGVKYQVRLPDGRARGYALELYQGHFALPELGPIGSDGLAQPRDFLAPVACFDEDCGATTATGGPGRYAVTVKFGGSLFATTQAHTPFDVVGWHGTYYPCKYDLGRYNTIGTISHDHPDPSIFTVLTAPSSLSGTAVADFVVFPPRWLVAEDTFRPPYYHRNTMSEFMGLVAGGVRRQARRPWRLRARRRQPAQRHERPRPGCREPRGSAGRRAAAGQGWGWELRFHVRELSHARRHRVGAADLSQGPGAVF